MKSKIDRVQDSMENIEGALSYYLYDINRQSALGKVTKDEQIILTKKLSNMARIISNLKFVNPFSHKRIIEIRKINLSINSAYLDNDYDVIFTEIVRFHNDFCKTVKERDKNALINFKKAFDHLPNFYKYRLSKAEIDDDDHMRFRDKGLDNVQYFLGNYLNARYNFKKIDFEPATVSEEYQCQIDDCTKVIESDSYSDEIKAIYSDIRRLISSVARAEIVINGLNKIIAICDIQELLNIKVRAKILLNKYADLYKENREKYEIVIKHLEAKTAEIIAVVHHSNENANVLDDNLSTDDRTL